jgi:hypothetical protein
VWWEVPGPWECPECENPLDGGADVGAGGRFRFISGTVNTRSAGAPSVGQKVSIPASRAGRDTTNSTPHAVQRNG